MLKSIFVATVVFGFASVSAFGGENGPIVGIDTTQILNNLDTGQPFKDGLSRSKSDVDSDPDCKKCSDLTLGHALAVALRTSTMSDESIARDALQKALRDALADQVSNNKNANLSSGDISTIKKALDNTPYNGALMRAIWNKIDPAGWEKAVKAAAEK